MRRHYNGASNQNSLYSNGNNTSGYNAAVGTLSCYGCIEGVNNGINSNAKLDATRSTTSAVDLASIVALATLTPSISNNLQSLRGITRNNSGSSSVGNVFKEGSGCTVRFIYVL